MMKYDIIRSRRKTISINIDRYGNITVKAPYTATDEAVMAFVDKKRDWIDKHVGNISVKNDARQ